MMRELPGKPALWVLAVPVLALALSCGVPVTARALELGEWVPGLKLTPFLSQRAEYNSNIFETHKDEKDDIILVTIPGFVLDYDLRPMTLSVAYRAEINEYINYSRFDLIEHFAAGQVKLDLPRLTATLRDDFKYSQDPPSDEVTGSEISGPQIYYENTLAPSVEFRITERLAVGAGYSWYTIRYDNDALATDRDLDTHRIRGSVFWRITSKGDISLNYAYSWDEYKDASDRDSSSHIVALGLRGELTARLSADFYFGYQVQNHDKGDFEDFSGYVMRGRFDWRPTSRTTLSLLLNRSIESSDFANSTYYESTGAGLELDQKLITDKLVGRLRVSGGLHDYPTKATVDGKTDWRQDWYVLAGGGIDYYIQRWLRVGADYSFEMRDSNFSTFDYDRHILAARVTLEF